MLSRALAVSLRQALRSVALILFPLVFISLFAWATAGADTGNTSDPIRASVWLWLGGHLVPLHIHGASHGALTVLPLLAVIFPIWALRRSYPAVAEVFKKAIGARIFLASWYAVISELLALASHSAHISASLYLAPLFAFIIAIIATTPLKSEKLRYFKFTAYLFTFFWGVASLVFAFSLASHWSVLKSLEIVITPGIIGGVLYTLIQILYIPNIALACLSYLTGTGFTFGAHTNISPSHFDLSAISAIPVLSALPTGKNQVFNYGIALWPIFFIVFFILVWRSKGDFAKKNIQALQSGAGFIAVILIISYLASGELFTPQLKPVGIMWGRFTAVIGISYVAALVSSFYIPALIQKMRQKNV
jgi:hypothetical protein